MCCVGVSVLCVGCACVLFLYGGLGPNERVITVGIG